MTPRRRGPTALIAFLRTERAGGVVLLVATAAALAWANGPWGSAYSDFMSTRLPAGPASLHLPVTVRAWVNEGLMAVFFLVAGLEIKRELVSGELRERRAAALPVLAAAGGMIVPAGIYAAINIGGPGSSGWGIPMATDIAFAVGVLSLLGTRVPAGLRVLLLALAILDDLGAVAVVALFYSGEVEWVRLALAGAVVAAGLGMHRMGVTRGVAYLPVFVAMWLALLGSGVHAAMAGAALGLASPARHARGRDLLGGLEVRLHPWASFVAIPAFALANAGIVLSGGSLRAAAGSRVALGVALGLVAGKTVGITLAALGAVRYAGSALPENVGMRHVAGVAALGGIGFTVALFVSGIALGEGSLAAEAKVGILAGSAASAVLGFLLLRGASSEAGR